MYPSFYDRNVCTELFLPRYELIAQEANKAQLQDVVSNDALFVIDAQIGFCLPGASLYVPGAEQDVVRLCDFIYRNHHNITRIFCSLDTHYAYQIFHASYWRNQAGENPSPYSIISYDDVLQNKWQPTANKDLALAYLKQLEESKKYQLCIWPYHTLMGSVEHALHPLLSESVFYQAMVSGTQPKFITKGENALTENYSVFAPEVKTLHYEKKSLQVGTFNRKLAETLLLYDRIFIAGEASSHCVQATVRDILSVVKEINPTLASKFYLLKDCMSPVPALPEIDFPALAETFLQEFATNGMNLVKSTDF